LCLSAKDVYRYQGLYQLVTDAEPNSQRKMHEAGEKQDAYSVTSPSGRRGCGQFAGDVSHEEAIQRVVANRSANPSPEEHGSGITSEGVDTLSSRALGPDGVRKRGRGEFAWEASEDLAIDEPSNDLSSTLEARTEEENAGVDEEAMGEEDGKSVASEESDETVIIVE